MYEKNNISGGRQVTYSWWLCVARNGMERHVVVGPTRQPKPPYVNVYINSYIACMLIILYICTYKTKSKELLFQLVCGPCQHHLVLLFSAFETHSQDYQSQTKACFKAQLKGSNDSLSLSLSQGRDCLGRCYTHKI